MGKQLIKARSHIAILDAIGAHGGMHYYTDNQASALVAAGHRVTVYSLPASTDRCASYAKVQTFRRIYGNDAKVIRGVRFFRDIASSLLSARRKGVRVLIYQMFKMDRFDQFIVAGARRMGMRTIAIVHDVERLDRPGSKASLASIASNCDIMAVHNAFSAAALHRVLGNIPANVTIIPSGNYLAQFPSPPSKIEARAKLNLPADRTIVLFFGNPRREKGLHILLDAIVAHRDSRSLLVLVAGKMKPEEESNYRAFAKANGLTDRVRFDIGHVSDDALPNYYRAADIVALPYLRIYESAVALMSMSFERPVLASDLQPLREIVGDDARGILFPVGNAAALSDRLREILSAPERLDLLATEATRYARDERSWARTGAMLSTVSNSFWD